MHYFCLLGNVQLLNSHCNQKEKSNLVKNIIVLNLLSFLLLSLELIPHILLLYIVYLKCNIVYFSNLNKQNNFVH